MFFVNSAHIFHNNLFRGKSQHHNWYNNFLLVMVQRENFSRAHFSDGDGTIG